MSATQQVDSDLKSTANNSKLKIVIAESGYNVVDEENRKAEIEGISSWETACEVHEMLCGEQEE